MTKAPTILAVATSLAALAGCTTMNDADMAMQPVGSATLSKADGTPVGTVELLGSGAEMQARISLTGLPPGPHGFHFHTTGRCEAPGFESAGGHLNPYDRNHGTADPKGPHLGDMRNITVGANGSVTATLDLPGARNGSLGDFFDADGTAVIVHAGADDYRSQPSGDAGGRLACGVLNRTG